METNIEQKVREEQGCLVIPSGILVFSRNVSNARTLQLQLSLKSEVQTLGFTPSIGCKNKENLSGLSRQGQLYKGLNCHLPDI